MKVKFTELEFCMKLLLATSEVFNAVTFHTAVFWVLKPQSLAGGKQNFRITMPPTSALNPAKKRHCTNLLHEGIRYVANFCSSAIGTGGGHL